MANSIIHQLPISFICTSASDVQPSNALAPILSILLGIAMLVSDLQPLKPSEPIIFVALFISIELISCDMAPKRYRCLFELLPIYFALSYTLYFKFVHFANASAPTSVMLSDKTTFSNIGHS